MLAVLGLSGTWETVLATLVAVALLVFIVRR